MARMGSMNPVAGELPWDTWPPGKGKSWRYAGSCNYVVPVVSNLYSQYSQEVFRVLSHQLTRYLEDAK